MLRSINGQDIFMPAAKDVYVDPLLTNLSVAYRNEEFIADQIFPRIDVDKKSGFYFTFNKENLRKSDSRRTGYARANRVDNALTKTPYGPLVEHSLEHFIEDDVIEQYDDPFDPRRNATNLLTEKLAIENEDDLATSLANTSVVTQNATLSGTAQWSDYTNSNPFQNIQTGLNAIQGNALKKANVAFMGYEVWAQIKHHPDLLDRIKYTNKGVLTEEILAELLGVQKVLS